MRRTIIVGAVVLALVAAAAAYGRFGAEVWRWGCPAQEEQERPHAPAAVVDAFAEAGVPLQLLEWPPELRHARSYRGALVYRHEATGATFTLVVCKARCELSRFQLRPGGPRRRHRLGFSMVNLAGWIAGEDGHAAARLRGALAPALDRLDRVPDPGSRCYVN